MILYGRETVKALEILGYRSLKDRFYSFKLTSFDKGAPQ